LLVIDQYDQRRTERKAQVKKGQVSKKQEAKADSTGVVLNTYVHFGLLTLEFWSGAGARSRRREQF
jgi:hypothetical protein